MWIDRLKVAVVQEDTELLRTLLDDIPKFKTSQELNEAIFLLQEATRIVQCHQDKIAESMKKMKKNIEFLDSATANQTAKFDITS